MNPILKHVIKDGWKMPKKPSAACDCCKLVYPAMWLDMDMPEGMVLTAWLSSCGYYCGEIDFPLILPGNHYEQMADLEVLGFELSPDRGVEEGYL